MNAWPTSLLAANYEQRLAAAWRQVQSAAHFARSEFQAHPIVYFTWLGLLICTFLLLRMLITRWGDKHVTRKAMILSLLLHMVGGLFTTTVHIATHAGESEERPAAIPVRSIVRESSARTDPRNSRQPGNRPVWEKLASAVPAPTERRLRTEATPPSAELARESPALRTEVASVPLPDLKSLVVSPAQKPQALRPVSPAMQPRAERPAQTTAVASLPEEASRASRAEATVGPTQPERQSRPALGSEISDLPVPLRKPESSTANAVQPDLSRAVTTALTPNTLPPERRRSATGEESTRSGAGTAALVPAELRGTAVGLPAGDPQVASGGKGTAPGSPFARMVRRGSSGETGSDNAARSEGELPTRSAGGGDAATEALFSLKGFAAEPGGGGTANSRTMPQLARAPSGGGPLLGAGEPAAYRLRGPEQRKKLAVENGASPESERAVELSLQWLANHQNPAGFWDTDGFSAHCPADNRCTGLARASLDPTDGVNTPRDRQEAGLDADTGVTGLAILAFLGAGYKHEEGPYADQLDRALRWLIRQQGEDGFLGGKSSRYARMYCHGMATIALGEAYGMTHDETLREPLSRAIQFIVDTQNTNDGGWRYVPGQISDMSIFGWQLMGLKSAQTAGLTIPRPTIDRCIAFLVDQGEALKSRNLSTHGGLASYRKYPKTLEIEPPKPSMTAEALFCKQILGIKRSNPAVAEAIAYIEQHPPRRATEDLYYWYYGTLALYQHGGPSWQQWNLAVRDLLVAEQRKDGHAAGSWDPRSPWGDFGGRVFTTALTTLTLEVYYRFLPMYRYDDQGRDAPGE